MTSLPTPPFVHARISPSSLVSAVFIIKASNGEKQPAHVAHLPNCTNGWRTHWRTPTIWVEAGPHTNVQKGQALRTRFIFVPPAVNATLRSPQTLAWGSLPSQFGRCHPSDCQTARWSGLKPCEVHSRRWCHSDCLAMTETFLVTFPLCPSATCFVHSGLRSSAGGCQLIFVFRDN